MTSREGSLELQNAKSVYILHKTLLALYCASSYCLHYHVDYIEVQELHVQSDYPAYICCIEILTESSSIKCKLMCIFQITCCGYHLN